MCCVVESFLPDVIHASAHVTSSDSDDMTRVFRGYDRCLERISHVFLEDETGIIRGYDTYF